MFKRRTCIVVLLGLFVAAAAVPAISRTSGRRSATLSCASHLIRSVRLVAAAGGPSASLVDRAEGDFRGSQYIYCLKQCVPGDEARRIILKYTDEPDFGSCDLRELRGKEKECVLNCLDDGSQGGDDPCDWGESAIPNRPFLPAQRR